MTRTQIHRKPGMTNRLASSIAAVGLLATGVVGCESNAGNGALLGGAGGAGLGAIIGHQSGHAGGGALIGGAVGALGGGLVGSQADKKEAERRAYDSGYRDSRYEERGYYDRRYDAPPPAAYRSETRTYRSGTGRGGYYRETYYEERRY